MNPKRKQESNEGQSPFLIQRRRDRRKHTVYVRQNIVIPKAQNAIAEIQKARVALDIFDAPIVLSTIQLNYQARFYANKIHDVRINN
jgi:hypothetical protein